jgi:hypothetical protein
MSKVYVIGDCHTSRSYSHHINSNISKNYLGPRVWENHTTIENTDIELKMWGLSGYKCWGMDLDKDYAENTLSSSAEDIVDIPGFSDNLSNEFGFSEVKQGDIIMPWIGYIDCRNHLPRYKNAEEVVKKYVDNTLTFFKDSRIRFIEPFPQFDYLGTHNYTEPFEYKEKTYWNDIFIEYLHKYSDIAGLMTPVSQSIVYKALNTDKIDRSFAKLGSEYHNYTLIDGLKHQYNYSVYKALVSEIKETVKYYSQPEYHVDEIW